MWKLFSRALFDFDPDPDFGFDFDDTMQVFD
jgi:hypothetical protein